MKIFKYFALLFFLVSNLYSQSKENFSLAVSISEYSIADQNRIKNLASSLLNKINDEIPINITMSFYEDEEKLLDDFKNKKNINTMILSPLFYFKNKKLVKEISKNPFIFKSQEIRKSQLLLIANKNSKINSINDLNNKSFANSLYLKNNSLWLDYLTLKKLNKSYKKIIKNESVSTKTSTALLDVYFNKADFCTIDENVYEDMLVLNPSLNKNLTIIEHSDEIFFFAFGSVHKDMSSESVKELNDFITNEKFKSNFREFFKLVNLYSASLIEFKDLKEIEEFYEEYENLKKKYN
jgi:ABC-type phosphate/phosphonate transport system substrate-binding protein